MARGERQRPTDPEIQISPEAIEAGERVHPLVADVVIKIDEALTEVDVIVQKYSTLPAEQKSFEQKKAEEEAQQLKTKALLAKAELHLLAGDLINPKEMTPDTLAATKEMAPIYDKQGQYQYLLPAAEMKDVLVPGKEELEGLVKVEIIRILATQEYLKIQEKLADIKRTERGAYPQIGDGFDSSGHNRITNVDMTGISGGYQSDTAYNQNVFNSERWSGRNGQISVMSRILNEKPVLDVMTNGQSGERGNVVIGIYTGYGDALNRKNYTSVEIPPLDAQTTLHIAHLERIKAKFQGVSLNQSYSAENRLQIDPETGVEYVKGINKAEETKNKVDALRDYVQVEEKFRAMVEKDLGANEPLTEPELRKRHKETKKTLAGKDVALAETKGALEQARTKETEAQAEVARLGQEVARLSKAQEAGKVAQAESTSRISALEAQMSIQTNETTKTQSISASNLETVKIQARLAVEAERTQSSQELQRVQAEHQKQLEQIKAILASAGAFNKGDKIKEVLALLGGS